MDSTKQDGGKGRRSRRGGEDRGRWSSSRKAEAVLRLLKGESLDTLSREFGVTASRLAQWRDLFLNSGQAGLKSRELDDRDREITRLRAKIGELMMDKELLEAFFERVDPALRPPSRRPR